MNVWLVSPAWGRFDVTRLALAQRAHLVAELAPRGVALHCVVVADDENLELAREYGFDTVERSNRHLGAKFNDGIEHALRHGADVVATVGSDDWVHASVFDRLPASSLPVPVPTADDPCVVWSPNQPEIIAGRRLTLVDLFTGRARMCRSRGIFGVIPWLIPASAFKVCRGRPLPDRQQRGIDGAMAVGLRDADPKWVFCDVAPFARVDFKSDVNLNTYESICRAIGVGEDFDPWPQLERFYPSALVEQARALSDTMIGAVAA